MGEIAKCREVLTLFGRIINEVVSFIVFCILDIVDTILCYMYKLADFYFEAEWRPCYCSSAKEAITSRDKIFVSEHGESKIVRVSSSKLQLDEVSDTLYARTSRVSEASKATIKRLKEEGSVVSSGGRIRRSSGSAVRSTYTVDTTAVAVEMLHDRIFGQQNQPIRKWSDCKCKHCTSWTSKGKKGLFVKTAGAKPDKAREDVLFIHGFISSSVFWTETLFPNFSDDAKSTYRFLAIDLLGFGKSPKPNDSLYTLREHLDMIEQSVLEQYKVKNFHIVAHSLGCILALALAVKNPGAVKSLTLLAPPYYPIPKGVQATQYVMRRVAPRRVWPIIGFGASIACWYEHITRTACLVVCKNHHFWESLTKLVTRNRIRTYMFEGFFCHTFNAAWHTLHNIICGTAGRIDAYLDIVRDRLKCDVTIFHGKDDELIPLECSYNVQRRIRRARVKVVENTDHLTIVIGRPKDFAMELEEIWKKSSC